MQQLPRGSYHCAAWFASGTGNALDGRAFGRLNFLIRTSWCSGPGCCRRSTSTGTIPSVVNTVRFAAAGVDGLAGLFHVLLGGADGLGRRAAALGAAASLGAAGAMFDHRHCPGDGCRGGGAARARWQSHGGGLPERRAGCQRGEPDQSKQILLHRHHLLRGDNSPLNFSQSTQQTARIRTRSAHASRSRPQSPGWSWCPPHR